MSNPKRGGSVFRGVDRGRGRGGTQGGTDRGPNFRANQQQQARAHVPPIYQPPDVGKLEDKLQSLNLTSNSTPPRPAYGTKGQKLTLYTNYVAMISTPEKPVYRYALSFEPDVKGRKLVQVIRLLLQAPELAQFHHDMVSDFRTTCISLKKLDQDDQTISIVYRAEHEDDPRQGATTYRVRVLFTNELSLGDLAVYLSSENPLATCDNKEVILHAFNIILSHHTRSASKTITMIGASRSFPMQPTYGAMGKLGAGLTVVRGFFASVRAATSRILINVNVSNAAFYAEVSLDKLIEIFRRESDNGNNITKLASFLKRLRIRTTHLPEKKNQAGEVIPRIRTICGLATPGDGRDLPQGKQPKVPFFGADSKMVEFWLEKEAPATVAPVPRAPVPRAPVPPPPVPRSGVIGAYYLEDETPKKSKNKNKNKKNKKPNAGAPGPASPGPAAPGPASTPQGSYISVYDFFQRKHQKILRKPNLPVVNVGTREKPIYLPPEFCEVMPGQSCDQKLSESQKQNMIAFSVRNPAANRASIAGDGLTLVGLKGNNPSLLITVSARLLGEPAVCYAGQYAGQKTIWVKNGGWNMTGVRFIESTRLTKWTYVTIELTGKGPYQGKEAYSSTMGSLPEAISEFTDRLKKHGVECSDPDVHQGLQIENADDDKLSKAIETLATDGYELVLFIIPAKITDLYGRIKYLGDVRFGIHTVCSVGSKLGKFSIDYEANVALKFNLKLGGINQSLGTECPKVLKKGETMVVGLDVTHPSAGSADNAPSIAGMVASVDNSLGQWPAILRIQAGRQEMVSDLTAMLKSRLQLWQAKNKTLPENILVYRDGVSEGQYKMVLNDELPLLRQACKEMYPATDQNEGRPRLTIVVVGKRHHTRFYLAEQSADQRQNTKPGTVVDRGVTELRNWDFFLQSHHAIKGTARPAHYFVVLDEIFGHFCAGDRRNVADELETVTQSLCYVYGRSTRAISLPAPVYLADKLCDRARFYLPRMFDAAPGTAESATATPAAAGAAPSVVIHSNLKDSMFYI
ncbi:ribonuclease H-like domain-containing protein [Echria macrotheca]|uniref:Ribonuclease H-like domain-containing protein n=1 Tax=Echria macrotheca TaxID=438768 RepID=A0AAJ0FA42_9PEZI|nr:ribonuclease H-like domain-containing protein [Echria macrotheca]